MPTPSPEQPPADRLPAAVEQALHGLGLLAPGAGYRCEQLTGGVSSEIWRLELPRGPVCVKRALARLRVAQEWLAPVSRNATEVAWFRTAAAILPGSAPRVLAHDPQAGVFVMDYLEPASHPLWKTLLAAGTALPAHAGAVAGTLARLHAATAGDASLAARFATDAAFHALRLDAYLLATARRHPALAPALEALVAKCTAHRLALVHGDASPKNILIGPGGPVFLDAETAWYGDPAFDLAFCLNHLLLKCLWRPGRRHDYLACFAAFRARYLAGVDWEAPAAIERRAAALLPGLLLARVDGKSPVEYLDGTAQEFVRAAAGAMLHEPPPTLEALSARWQAALADTGDTP